jgi:hypothetical protein
MTIPTQPITSAVFSTEDLPFAAYLHASRKLRFLTCQVNSTDRVAFVFADPNQEGNQLHVNFDRRRVSGRCVLRQHPPPPPRDGPNKEH